jgi:hypothetical protein
MDRMTEFFGAGNRDFAGDTGLGNFRENDLFQLYGGAGLPFGFSRIE